MSPLQIVLIEDHELTRMGLKVAFQQQSDIELVGESGTGLGGLSLLTQYHPDVAIVDIGLPDIDGIEMIRRYREAQAAGDSDLTTKMLMLTMNDSEDAVMAAFAAGADSYCMKQTEINDLITAVRETYAGHSHIDPAIASTVLRQLRRAPVSVSEEDMTVAINAIETEYKQLLETYPLTERELEILEMIVEGYRNSEIAEKSFITIGTVKTHVRNILNKLGVDDRTKAAVRALRAGLVH